MLDVSAGDVLVLPAGVLHRAMTDSSDFRMVGAYPAGSPSWDMKYGEDEAECRQMIEKTSKISVPPKDPATGKSMTHWAS